MAKPKETTEDGVPQGGGPGGLRFLLLAGVPFLLFLAFAFLDRFLR